MALLYRLDARDALSKPITNGTAIAAWEPSGGTIADDVLQTTLGARPIYRSNYNSSGYPAADFDGSNDVLTAIDSESHDHDAAASA